MEEIIVSVLMPTYNHESFITYAIESFLRQEVNFRIELLIGDDCSTDNTSVIAQKFASQYPDKIHYFKYCENHGLMQNYKFLLEKAKGKYIAILESDDIWIDSFKLQKQVDLIETNNQCGIVCSNWIVIGSKSEELERSKKPKKQDYSELLKTNFIGAVTVLFSRNFFDRYCSIDDYIKYPFKTFDYPTWLSISAHSDIIYLNDYTSAYRCLPTSISNNKDYHKVCSFNKSIDEIISYVIAKNGIGNLSYKELENAKRWRYMILNLLYGKLYSAFKEASSFRIVDFRTFVIKYFWLIWLLRNKHFLKKSRK